MQLFSSRTLTAGFLLLGFCLSAQSAKGDFVLNLGNADIQGVTGSGANQLDSPYATLSIVGNTTTGQVTFTLAASAHNAASPINAVFSDINFNTSLVLGTDFTLLSASNGGTIGAGKNTSEFGQFDYSVGGPNKNDRDNPYVFVLQLTDHSKALESNFAIANAKGDLFAAHMFTDIGPNGTTGFIGGGGGGNLQFVPAPAGLILLASGLPVLGLCRLVRRKPVAA